MSIDSEFPPWPQWDSNKHAGDPVYDWANSGHLGGLGVIEDKANNTLSFILDRGEPGQSGSLMYNTATHTTVGVFHFGVRATRANMVTPRGQIVRAPLLEDLLRHEVVSQRQRDPVGGSPAVPWQRLLCTCATIAMGESTPEIS